jgi:NSS family neurotransmitter:Na+ symporter
MTSERWSSRLGFLLATVGAAVGLGNVWRFSAVVGQNGGGAYLLAYLLAAVVCAVPMLVLELAVGRTLRRDVVAAFRSVGPDYDVLGWLVVGGVLLVVSYYLVLTGWVLGFFLTWLAGTQTTFAAFTAGWAPVGFSSSSRCSPRASSRSASATASSGSRGSSCRPSSSSSSCSRATPRPSPAGGGPPTSC